MATVYEEQHAPRPDHQAAPAADHRPARPLAVGSQTAPAGYPGQVFGEDPVLYDRFRPGYPRGLMETVVAGTGRGPVLEIGAGTGKATRALLALGRPVLAVEPDHRMAALLELNCGLDRVSIVRDPLERAELPAEAFELAVAAHSWNWVDPVVSYARVSEALVPHGRLALLAHHPEPDQGLVGEAMAQLHAKLAPELTTIWPGAEAAGLDPPVDHVGASTRFRSWVRHEHRWQRQFDGVAMVGWLCTGAEQRRLPVGQRMQLMTAVAALVAEFGGEVTLKMRSVALLAHRV